jgi:hypothetical protein
MNCKNCISYACAGSNGHLECLKHFHPKAETFEKCVCKLEKYGDSATLFAAIGGNMECMKYLVEEAGCYLSPAVSAFAAERHHFKILEYLYSKGCPMNGDLTLKAVTTNSLKCLKFAIQKGCEIDEFAYIFASGVESYECLDYLLNDNVVKNCSFDYMFVLYHLNHYVHNLNLHRYANIRKFLFRVNIIDQFKELRDKMNEYIIAVSF